MMIYLYHMVWVFTIRNKFILQFVNMVYYADSFADIRKKTLHLSSKSHLIMVYEPFTILGFDLLVFLLKIFGSMFTSDIGLWFSSFLISLSGFGTRVMASQNKYGSVFCLLGILKSWFQFHTCDWSVHIFYFFLGQSWEIVPFKEFVHLF